MTYPADGALSSGQRYPALEQLGPEVKCRWGVKCILSTVHCRQGGKVTKYTTRQSTSQLSLELVMQQSPFLLGQGMLGPKTMAAKETMYQLRRNKILTFYSILATLNFKQYCMSQETDKYSETAGSSQPLLDSKCVTGCSNTTYFVKLL